MQIQKRSHWREDFTVAEHAFEEWRAARKKGARIPHGLWQMATELAARHSVAKVAVTLGLDFYSIKRRLTGQTQQTKVAPASKPAFVAMQRGHLRARWRSKAREILILKCAWSCGGLEPPIWLCWCDPFGVMTRDFPHRRHARLGCDRASRL